MKISVINKFYSLIFILLFYSSNIPLLAEEPAVQEQSTSDQLTDLSSIDPEIIALIKKEQTDFLEKLLTGLLEQIKKIDVVLEHWAQIVNNNQLNNGNKQEIIAHIKEWRSLVGQLKKGSYVVVDPMSIKILGDITKSIIQYLHAVSKNGLTTFHELNFDDIITRSVKEEFDLEKIQTIIDQNEKELATLDRESQYIGLSLFNRIYRRSENFVNDYHLFRKAFIGMGLTLASYILISRLQPDWLQNKDGKYSGAFGWLKENVFGDKPRYGRAIDSMNSNFFAENQLINNDDLSWMGKIEHYLSGHGLGVLNLTVPELLTIPVIARFYQGDWYGLTTWFKKNVNSIRGKLRGGPAQQTIEPWKKNPKARFKDILGQEHHKRIAHRIIDYMRNRERYDRAGILPEAGYMLAGPSRTGKTYFAEAVAGEIKDAFDEIGLGDKFQFLSFDPDRIDEVGGIRNVLYLAEALAPCFLFVDEFDLCKFQSEGDHKSLASLMTAMSGVLTKDISRTVIIMAATNKPENIHQNLIQKGRFGKILHFDYPIYEDRLAYLERELDNRTITDISHDYLAKLARESDHCTFEQLNSVIITALQYAKKIGQPLNEEHFERAFDEEIRQIIFDELVLPEHEKNLIAVHEAGHALAMRLLNQTENTENAHNMKQLVKVTIRPVETKIQEEGVWMKYWQDKERQKPTEHGKIFTSSVNNSIGLDSYEDLINQLKVHIAGHVAEKIIFGKKSSNRHHSSDRGKAFAIAKYLTFKDLKFDELDNKEKERLMQKAIALRKQCKHEITELLMAHKNQLITISQALQEKLTLTSEEIEVLFNTND